MIPQDVLGKHIAKKKKIVKKKIYIKGKVYPKTFQNMEANTFVTLTLEDKAFHIVMRYIVNSRL